MVYEKDRRRLLRAAVNWPATIITSHGQAIGETKSISQAGVSLCCSQSPPIGRECRLEIQPPHHQPILVSAKTLWVLETNPSEMSSRFIIGAEFEYISEDDVLFLGKVIANQLGKNPSV
jgi:hypothetical protein